MNCAQLLRKANDLKAEISEGHGDLWVTRQSLQEVYQQLLLADLEYALDKKVEQDLWNHVFKNQISALQRKAKDKTNLRRNEVQAMLTFILDSASGFYLQLLQELCSAFTLDIPCRVRTSQLGMSLEKSNGAYHRVIIPQHSSCLYICQHCLVHLGDLARYRNVTSQAESYYLHAANLVPTNGQPYNQLAIVAASKADQLAMTFYYIRSIAVKHPFPAAATNLQTTFAKLVDRDEVKLFKMKEVELIHFFIKFHAIIYLAMGEQDLQIASAIKEKLEENFRSHLAQDTLTSCQLVQISAINLFALNSIRQDPGSGGKKTNEGSSGDIVQDGCYSADEKLSWSLTLGLTLTLLQLMLNYMPTKSEDMMLMWPGLPATKVLLDWMAKQPAIFSDPVLTTKSMIWGKLARVLNTIQPEECNNKLPSYRPLPEDTSLRGFLPLIDAHSMIKFSLTKKQKLTEDEEMAERASQLVAHGRKLVDNYPSLMKIEAVDDTGRKTFSSPAGDDTTKRPHHQKQKTQKQTQLQQRHKPEAKFVTIVDPVKFNHETSRVTPLKSVTPGKSVASGAGKVSPNTTTVSNVKGSSAKKGRERRDSEGTAHVDRGKGGGRKGTGEHKMQSIAVQAILPRHKTSPEASTAKKARQPSPISDMQQQHSPPLLPEQNPMQTSPSYPQLGYGGPHHHPGGPPPPLHHPWQGPGPGPPPYPPPPGPPMHGPPHPPGPFPPYMSPQVPPPNFRNPPPPLPHPQRPPQGEMPWQHKPVEPPLPHMPPQNMQQHARDGQKYDSYSHVSQRDNEGWPTQLPVPPTNTSTDRSPQHPPPSLWGGRQISEQEPAKLSRSDMGIFHQQPAGTNSHEQRFQSPIGKPGTDFPTSRPVAQQQLQTAPPRGQYPPVPPPPFGAQPHHGKSLPKFSQPLLPPPPPSQNIPSTDLEALKMGENLLELLVKMQSQSPQQNFPNGGSIDSTFADDRSLSSQEKALEALAVGLGLQNPVEKMSSPQRNYSQYESLLNSLQSSSNPDQSFSGAVNNRPSASTISEFQFTDFDLDQIQPSKQSSYNAAKEPTQGVNSLVTSSSQPRLPPGLHGLEGVPPPFENHSASLFSPPQQHKSIEPTPGAPADWRSSEPMRGMPMHMQGSASQLFPTREEHQDRQRGEYTSWSSEKSLFGSVRGERRHQRQRETPTFLMPDNASESFRIPSSSPSIPAGTGTIPSFLGEKRDGLGVMQHRGSAGSSFGKMAENRSSLFPASTERRSSLEETSFNSSGGSSGASGSYSLFSWSGSKEGLNLSSSPFSSSPSSPRSQSPSIQYNTHHQQDTLRGLGLGWSPAERSSGSSWGAATSRGHQLSSSPTSGLLPESLQSIWSSPMSSSEPSPLEQLLKNQRQRDHDT